MAVKISIRRPRLAVNTFAGCSNDRAVEQELPDSAIVHARVEVDAVVPLRQAELPLLVDQGLVLLVHVAKLSINVIVVEGCNVASCHIDGGIANSVTISHRIYPGLSHQIHVHDASSVLLILVEIVSLGELVINLLMCFIVLGREAFKEIVACIYGLAAVGVDETSHPLRCIILIENLNTIGGLPVFIEFCCLSVPPVGEQIGDSLAHF